MRYSRLAEHPHAIPAPKEFNDRLAREVNKDLVCWWEPTSGRRIHKKDGTWTTVPGAWVIFSKERLSMYVPFGGNTICITVDQYVDVFQLDGEFNCPTTLGPWVFHCLRASDMTRRGNHDRNKQINDHNEKAILDRFEKEMAFANDWSKDKFVKRINQIVADAVGTKTKLKEEIREEVRRAEAIERRMHDEAVRNAKASRYYQE